MHNLHTWANKQKSIQNLNITNSIEVTIVGVARGAQEARPTLRVEMPLMTKV